MGSDDGIVRHAGETLISIAKELIWRLGLAVPKLAGGKRRSLSPRVDASERGNRGSHNAEVDTLQ